MGFSDSLDDVLCGVTFGCSAFPIIHIHIIHIVAKQIFENQNVIVYNILILPCLIADSYQKRAMQ